MGVRAGPADTLEIGPRRRYPKPSVATPEGQPTQQPYAPSTVRRYSEITTRFLAWCKSRDRSGSTAPDLAGFLAALAEPASPGMASPQGGRCDPRHLALRRTTICALRASLDRPIGLELTTAVRLPPRAPPVPAAEADTVAALRRAAGDMRERLLVILACDLGLRPGQMVARRWEDVSLPESRVYVDGPKGRLAVAIPASRHAVIQACARGHAPGSFLFPSPRRGDCTAATVRTLQNALRRLAKRAGVASGTTFTSLRKAVSPADVVSLWVPAEGAVPGSYARSPAHGGRSPPDALPPGPTATWTRRMAAAPLPPGLTAQAGSSLFAAAAWRPARPPPVGAQRPAPQG